MTLHPLGEKGGFLRVGIEVRVINAIKHSF